MKGEGILLLNKNDSNEQNQEALKQAALQEDVHKIQIYILMIVDLVILIKIQ